MPSFPLPFPTLGELPYLCNDGVHLLHAQRDHTGQEGFEHLAWLLHHHLQDLQELLHHPAARAALVEDALCQLLPRTKQASGTFPEIQRLWQLLPRTQTGIRNIPRHPNAHLVYWKMGDASKMLVNTGQVHGATEGREVGTEG